MQYVRRIITVVFMAASLPAIGQQAGKGSDTLSLKRYAPIPIGVAIGYAPMIRNKVYRDLVEKNFDQVTFEFELKNAAVVRPDGSFDYHRADTLVSLCRRAGLGVYGHTLCWYQNNSPYLYSLRDSAAVENFLKKYIRLSMHRYQGTIRAWDVVNEAVDSAGNLRMNGRRKRGYFYWGRWLKQGYIARAFRYAHAADPAATLFYNDYDLETDSLKLNAVVRLAERLKRDGVPVSGLGTQMHISINTPEEGIDRAFRKLASTGLLIRISELDIKVNPSGNSDFEMTPALAAKQAEKCRQVLEGYFRYVPAAQRYGITFWNLGEKDSWIVKGYHKGSPTLFDGEYHPKPMYDAVLAFFKKGPAANRE